ncbi:MAG: hypothetical protein J7L50_01825 [Candidatus Odinarchaeota archaeon]|nr:hypothetical protein [Candidatus Odinarchaeota archaeon]
MEKLIIKKGVHSSRIQKLIKFYRRVGFNAKLALVGDEEFDLIIEGDSFKINLKSVREGGILRILKWSCEKGCEGCKGLSINMLSSNDRWKLSLTCPEGLIEPKIIEVSPPLILDLDDEFLDKFGELDRVYNLEVSPLPEDDTTLEG